MIQSSLLDEESRALGGCSELRVSGESWSPSAPQMCGENPGDPYLEHTWSCWGWKGEREGFRSGVPPGLSGTGSGVQRGTQSPGLPWGRAEEGLRGQDMHRMAPTAQDGTS